MKQLRFHYLFYFILSSFFLFSCGSEEEEEAEPNRTTFGIRADKSLSDYEKVASNVAPYNTDDIPSFSSVIAFSYSVDGSNTADYVATGTLIAPNWILTAGHNFYVAEEQSSPAPASGIRILVGTDSNNPSSTHTVERVVYHPSWETQNEDFVRANDLCLIKLSTPITTIVPAQINTELVNLIGQTTWFCGFGDYSQTAGQNKDLLSKKHAIQNILDRQNTGIESQANGVTYRGGLLGFDFDSPSRNVNSLGDTRVAADEALLGTGTSDPAATEFEGTTVQGDSGGPLFIKVGNTWKLCGVLSGGADEPIVNHADGDYGDISIFIRVATHADWIESVIQ